jgi:hypothetical protein
MPLAATGFAYQASPYVGVWRAIDQVDNSLMRAAIRGPVRGRFFVTWTESYFTFCDGRDGLAVGTGRLDPADPNILEVEMRLGCFRTGETMRWHQVWQYRPTYDDLVSRDSGIETIWKRLGQPIVPRATFVAYVPGAAEGYDWPMGHTISLGIPEREYSTQAVSEQEPGSPEGETRVLFELWRDDLSLEVGDHVLMTDESIGLTKDVVVTNLAVTGFDLSAGTVTGVFDPAYDLWVWLYGEEGQVPAKEGDVWTATFAVLPPGASGGATQWDVDGDGTSIDFYVPNPHFSVFPEQEYIEGWEWPDGTWVSASVEDKQECTATGLSGHPEWDPEAIFVSMTFPEGCDVEAGDNITLTDGVTPRNHVAQNLAVGSVDVAADLVAGTAIFDPELYSLHAWIHGVDGSYMQLTAEGGTWQADFSSTGLEAGMCGRVEIRDEVGNSTAVDWCAPNPHFTVFPMDELMHGYDWPDGTVAVSVAEKDVCSTARVSSGGFFNGPFPETCDVAEGDVVTFDDGITTRRHTVQDLAITSADAADDTVAGTATFDPELYSLHAWIHGVDGSYMQLTAEGGTWQADFSSTGLEAGMCGRVEIRDEAGNSTAEDWCIEPMSLRINYGHDWVESFYVADHEVELTVKDSYGEVKATATVFTEPREYWGWESGFTTVDTGWYDGITPDLQPGDWVYATVDNGVTAQVQIGEIQGEIDIGADSIMGTIDAPWLDENVQVECLDWGSGGDPINKDAGMVQPNGSDVFTCDWDESEWDMWREQDVGVGYFSADGHWVANAFQVPRAMMYVYPMENVVVGTNWIADHPLHLAILDGSGDLHEFDPQIVQPPSEVPWTATHFYMDDYGYTLQVGDRIIMSQSPAAHGSTWVKWMVVTGVQITGLNIDDQIVYGTGDPEAQIIVWIEGVEVFGEVADDGNWSVYHPSLVAGVTIQVFQRDYDGDETRHRVSAPE